MKKIAMIIGGLLLTGALACEPSAEHTERSHDEHEGHDEREGHDEHDEHGAEAPRHVALDPEAIERAGIEVADVSTGSLSERVSATAVVKHDVNRVAHISPLVEGQIVDVEASLGDAVQSGDVVAVMHSVALGKARAKVGEARAALDVAKTNFERQKRLRDKGIASERAFVEAQGRQREAEAHHDGARSRLRTLGVRGGSGPRYPLRSKIDGTIIEQHASVGETKGPRDELFVVADQSEVWVIGQIAEKDAYRVRDGMRARVRLDAYPARTWEGTIDWIGSTVDQDTRLLSVRVELPNPDGLLKPGMFGTLDLDSNGESREFPLVPIDAVQKVDGHDVVFVPADEEGEFQAMPVQVGAEAGGLAEIVEGLEPDATVVTRGAFDLKATLTAAGRSAAHHH